MSSDGWESGREASRGASAGDPPPDGRALWARQVPAILALELRKAFLSRRWVPVVVLALAPVMMFGARALSHMSADEIRNVGEATTGFAVIFQGLIVRLMIFFGCVAIFTTLFRGEVMDRSLHYYFLAPLRREVLVAGKYLAGLFVAVPLFTATTVLCYVLTYLPHGSPAVSEHVFSSTGAGHLLTYAAVAALACVGYGAVFTAVGILFRNPPVSSVAILGWESLNFLLPPMLKKISIAHHLYAICPVPVPEGALALLAEPTPAWIAIPALLLVTGALLVLSALLVRRSEVLYGSE